MAQAMEIVKPGTLAREFKQEKAAKRDATPIGNMKTSSILGYVLRREVYKHRVFLLSLTIVVTNTYWIVRLTNIKPF